MDRVGSSLGELPRYRMEALCLSIPAAQFSGWLAGARAGDEVPYASGAVLDGQRDVVVLAREAAVREQVWLFQRRRTEGGFEYLARRTAVALFAEVDSPERPRWTIEPDSELGRVLTLLTRHADYGLPCPSNRDIAVALRIGDGRRVRYLIQQLDRMGIIAVTNRGQRVTRIVTITATGKRTSDAQVSVGRGFFGERP